MTKDKDGTISGSETYTADSFDTTLSLNEFTDPSVENDMRYRRNKVELQQEFLAAWRNAQMCKYADITFKNELDALDRQVAKLQAAYLDTFLLPPFDGIVTGVFASPGDWVGPGQPVVRVENDTSVYLIGTVKCRGLIRVGSTLKVITTLFEAAGAEETSIVGAVAAVRGHDSSSEQWEILARCSNRSTTGEPLLPLNYNFDFDSTRIEVTDV